METQKIMMKIMEHILIAMTFAIMIAAPIIVIYCIYTTAMTVEELLQERKISYKLSPADAIVAVSKS